MPSRVLALTNSPAQPASLTTGQPQTNGATILTSLSPGRTSIDTTRSLKAGIKIRVLARSILSGTIASHGNVTATTPSDAAGTMASNAAATTGKVDMTSTAAVTPRSGKRLTVGHIGIRPAEAMAVRSAR